MKPKIAVICQEGGHQVAIEYSRLLQAEGYQVMVNFPSAQEFAQADSPAQLINERTAAIVLIVSSDIFPTSGRQAGFRIDVEIVHDLLTVARSESRARLIPILLNRETETYVKNHWLGQLQYTIDNAIEREKVIHRIDLLAGQSTFSTDISSFEDVRTIIAAMEPGHTIDCVAKERNLETRISYEVYECRHRVRKVSTYYIYLHKGITISNTAEHVRTHHPTIFADSTKTALLSIENGQTQIEDRLKHVTGALGCRSSFYLEQIIDGILEGEFADLQGSFDGTVDREFLDPQVRRIQSSIGFDPPSEFSSIVSWLSGRRSGVLVLLGQGGIGKTWALLNLRQKITQGSVRFAKSIKRSLIFITSTDVNKSVASAQLSKRSITLYDLYLAYHVALYGEDSKDGALKRETFYDAIELGNLIIFIDGLDEIISRNRSRFDPTAFFEDLSSRLVGDTAGKIVISCRNIFFDLQQTYIDFPYVETWELLPFDKEKRDAYFLTVFSDMPRRLRFAIDLSNQIALLPSGLYIPFVLSLIRKIAMESADGGGDPVARVFDSSILNPVHDYDRIIGQFCHREMDKAADPTIELLVDQQIRVFCRIARLQEGSRGFMSRSGVESALAEVLDRRDVKAVADHLETHPFISQDALKLRGIFAFSFDFMPEYFLMLDANIRMIGDVGILEDDVRIYNKYCTPNSYFAQELVRRWPMDHDAFRLRLLEMNSAASMVIFDTFPAHDHDLLSPDSAAAQFSFSIVSLLALLSLEGKSADGRSFTDSLVEIFEDRGSVRSMAILDGFVQGDDRIRIDFRGRVFEDCLFHSLDFWSCKFDSETVFKRCRFMRCGSDFSRSSGAHEVTWLNCHFDAEFEATLARGQSKIENSEMKKILAVKSLVSDFYRAGSFRPISKVNVQTYYSQSNSAVPFARLFRAMKDCGVLVEVDKGHYTEIRVAKDAMAACERLITQGDPDGLIIRVCGEL